MNGRVRLAALGIPESSRAFCTRRNLLTMDHSCVHCPVTRAFRFSYVDDVRSSSYIHAFFLLRGLWNGFFLIHVLSVGLFSRWPHRQFPVFHGFVQGVFSVYLSKQLYLMHLHIQLQVWCALHEGRVKFCVVRVRNRDNHYKFLSGLMETFCTESRGTTAP